MSAVDSIDTALITGGAGGIGKALAQFLISRGKKVIIVGRTEKKLAETSKEIGATAYYVLDTGKTEAIPGLVKKVTEEHPDLNCLINNAGVQQPLEFPGAGGKDYDFDLKKADAEIDINIRGPMHLIIALLPHLTSVSAKSGKKSVIINVSSVLGFVPFSLVNPVYNGTKAWLHNFTLNLRAQFEQGPARDQLKVIELAPPQVESDLHRDRVDPDDNKKSKSDVALSMEEFMEEVVQGLDAGDDMITAGLGKKMVAAWDDSMGSFYKKAISG